MVPTHKTVMTMNHLKTFALGTHTLLILVWYYCRQDESLDYLIGCKNNFRPIQWFHLSCVNMTMLHMAMEEVPDGDWFCPECHQTM